MPGPTILPFGGKSPRIHETAFIAPGARIIGDVEIGADASIWYNCVLRGDLNRIVIGVGSNLQDGTIVHVEGGKNGSPGLPTIVQDRVLVGHAAILHGCELESGAFIGMGAIIMDECRVSAGSLIAAGAMLTPGRHVPPGQLWAGRPAKFMRVVEPQEATEMAEQCRSYVENARAHQAALDEQG
jgi:carbonic anhydrase/acetyltransferase-like protein (isoleucine patch superfamily)